MSDIEIFEMNSNGAGWVSLESLPIGDILEIEIELATSKPNAQMLCAVCLTPIASGTGFTCSKHS